MNVRTSSRAARAARFVTPHHRTRFLFYITAVFVPFLVITLLINVRFLNTHAADTAEIVQGVSAQASSRLSALYRTSESLAQHIASNQALQDEILSGAGAASDYQRLNRNILKLRSIVKGYLFFDEIAAIPFYLPDSLIVPNVTDLLSMDTVPGEPWYANYARGRTRRWYLSDSVQGMANGRDVCSLICPIQNPMNYLDTIGYLRVDVRKHWVEQILLDGVVVDGTDCLLFDGEGEVILHRGALDTAALTELDAWYALAMETGAHSGNVHADGVPCLLSVSRVEGAAMAVAYLVPQASLTRSVMMNTLFQMVLFLLEMILLACVTGLLAYSMISAKNNQLKLLNHQLNPHFLYNTLDMINWQAISLNLPEIYQPIQLLSRFYKITLNRGDDFICVSDEIEQIRLYLNLINVRFKNSITYQIEVQPTAHQQQVLHMVLQPIVENAVLHGILEKDDPTGSISITAELASNQIVFTVCDDGVGMDNARAQQLLHSGTSSGYGLANVQQRIQLFYGKKYGISIHSEPGKGTTVRVSLPSTSPSEDAYAMRSMQY